MIPRTSPTTGRRFVTAVLLLALVPQLVLPFGSVLCIEPCGQVRLAASHVAQGCEHDEGEAHDSAERSRSRCDGCACGGESEAESIVGFGSTAPVEAPAPFEVTSVPPTCCDIALDLDPVTESTRRLDRSAVEFAIERPRLEDAFARVTAPLEGSVLEHEPPPDLATPRHPGAEALPRPLRI